jgi:hypothetical protein
MVLWQASNMKLSEYAKQVGVKRCVEAAEAT